MEKDIQPENNQEKPDSSKLLECVICFSSPAEDPVVTQCGHIFCWICLKKWVNNSDKMFCPICKNGINMDRVISLYANSTNKHHDKPKAEREAPVTNRNRPGFIRTIYNSLTYSGEDENVIPLTANEVKANRIAFLMVILLIVIFALIFYS